MKQAKNLTALLLTVLLAFGMVAVVPVTVSAADDRPVEPIEFEEISTVEDLYMINFDLAGNYKLMNDIDLSEATAEGGEWDYLGNGWEPIGSNSIYGSTSFKGTFDGNGYEIKGMRIDVKSLPSGTGTVYVGLFANNNGTIKNLTVSGSVSAGSNIRVNYAGAIAGYNTGTIEACCNKAEITMPYGRFVSGIAGVTYDPGKVRQCYNTGSISAANNSSNGTYASGISFCDYNGIVSDCYNTGNITASNTYNANIAYSAGISACSGSGTIKYCYNIGTATKLRSRFPMVLTQAE